MPYKVWIPGEEVLSADFNAHVQEQVVATFPNAAARTTGIAVPKEGMVTWLADTNRLEVYDGAGWSLPRNLSWGYVHTTGALTTGNVVAVGAVYVTNGDFTLPAVNRRYAVHVSVTAILGPGDCNMRVECPGQGLASFNARANSGAAVRQNLVVNYVAAPTLPAHLSWRTLFGATTGSGYVEAGGLTVYDIGPGAAASARPGSGDDGRPELEPLPSTPEPEQLPSTEGTA